MHLVVFLEVAAGVEPQMLVVEPLSIAVAAEVKGIQLIYDT